MKMSRMILIAFLCGFVISGGLIVKAVLFEGKQASDINPASMSASPDPTGMATAGIDQSTNPDLQASAIGDPAALASAVGDLVPSASAATASAGVSASAPKLVLTLSQLTAANGQNGASAYIAYRNNVYDLAGDPAFVSGIHKYNNNIKAGMDLTFLFDKSAPGNHKTNDYISRFIQIGVMDPSYAGPDPNFILPGGGNDN